MENKVQRHLVSDSRSMLALQEGSELKSLFNKVMERFSSFVILQRL